MQCMAKRSSCIEPLVGCLLPPNLISDDAPRKVLSLLGTYESFLKDFALMKL